MSDDPLPRPWKYVLDLEGKPLPIEDLHAWAIWFETADRHVAKTQIGPRWVSTVFLGIDHQWGDGPPVLYETMVFADSEHTDYTPALHSRGGRARPRRGMRGDPARGRKRPMFVIWSIEHEAWWRPVWAGYPRELAEAGRYDQAEADAILIRANFVTVNECAIPLACVGLAAAVTGGQVMDEDLLVQMTAEVIAHEAPIEMVLRPLSALHLAGLLQLALRHPGTRSSEAHARIAVTFIEHVRAYFADAPAVLEVLRRGADPSENQ